jgi:thioesterase domain-containing protein
LGVELVGVKDNFFDLGGDSLLAVRMVARLQKRLKREIPLSSVIEAGTIESLAQILRDRESGNGKSPLVAMQPRGSRHPFFCVHPGSGNVLCFLALTQRMDIDRPFYGIQDPSVLEDPGQEEIDMAASIEDLAGRYIEVVKTAQPHGPYHLGGWSFGGFVAFEMAQQLLRQGEEVGLLAILDTGWGAESLRQADDAELLAMLGVEAGLQISAEDLRPFHPQQRLQWLAERLKAANSFLDEIPSTWISFMLKVFKARLWAVSHHVFKPYPGRITLFRAAEMEADKSEFIDQFSTDPTKGWGRLSSMPVDIQVVPGNHATMVREPHVKVLAEKLTACLEKTG